MLLNSGHGGQKNGTPSLIFLLDSFLGPKPNRLIFCSLLPISSFGPSRPVIVTPPSPSPLLLNHSSSPHHEKSLLYNGYRKYSPWPFILSGTLQVYIPVCENHLPRTFFLGETSAECSGEPTFIPISYIQGQQWWDCGES